MTMKQRQMAIDLQGDNVILLLDGDEGDVRLKLPRERAAEIAWAILGILEGKNDTGV